MLIAAARVPARMARDHGPLSNASRERRSRSDPTEAEAKARPSVRIRMRAPPHRGGKRTEKDRRRPANSALVATADHTGKQPQQDLLGHFHELMKSPCTNHDYPIKHLYKDYQLLKRLLR